MQVVLAGLAGLVLLLFGNFRRIWSTNKCNIDVVSPTWEERLSRKPTTAADLIRRGYNTYCISKGRSFRLGQKIILPPALFEEFRKLPDTILSADAAFQDTLHIEFTLGPESQIVPSFIQRRLNSSESLQRHVPVMYEETKDALRTVLLSADSSVPKSKDPGQWASIELLHATQSVISQVICRLLVGKTMARHSEFTQKVADFSYSVILWSIIFDWCPGLLRPLVSWILPIKKTKKAISCVLRQHIVECIDSQREVQVDVKGRSGEQESVLLPELVGSSLIYGIPNADSSIEQVIEGTTDRVLSITFGAIDPTTVAFSQVVLDLLSQPSGVYFTALREEARKAFAAHGDAWTFEAVKSLKLMDSFIRESQRLHPIGVALAARKVTSKGGWTFQNGDHAHEGSLVAVPTYAVHRDKNWYPKPDVFDGFRFVKKEVHVGGGRGRGNQSVNSQGDAFLAFGYGRHACSGRAFGAVIIKLLLVNLILDYELEELSIRPADKALGNYLVPDLKTTIRLRQG